MGNSPGLSETAVKINEDTLDCLMFVKPAVARYSSRVPLLADAHQQVDTNVVLASPECSSHHRTDQNQATFANNGSLPPLFAGHPQS